MPPAEAPPLPDQTDEDAAPNPREMGADDRVTARSEATEQQALAVADLERAMDRASAARAMLDLAVTPGERSAAREQLGLAATEVTGAADRVLIADGKRVELEALVVDTTVKAPPAATPHDAPASEAYDTTNAAQSGSVPSGADIALIVALGWLATSAVATVLLSACLRAGAEEDRNRRFVD